MYIRVNPKGIGAWLIVAGLAIIIIVTIAGLPQSASGPLVLVGFCLIVIGVLVILAGNLFRKPPSSSALQRTE